MVRKNTNTKKNSPPLKRGESLFDIATKLGEEFKISPQDYVSGKKFQDSISTGIADLDRDLNYGKGIPLGIMCEFYGKESGGKSYLAQVICALARKKYPDKAVIYVDLENSVMPERMREIGVNPYEDDMWIEIPQTGDADVVINYVKKLLQEIGENVSVLVIDSLKAFTKPEWAMDNQKTHLAQFLSKNIPEIHALCTSKNIAAIMINQVRIDLNAAMRGMTNAEVTPGGDTVNFFAHLRLRVKKVPGKDGLITIGDKVVGHRMEIFSKKSKLGIPQQTYYAPLYYMHVSLEDRLFILGRSTNYADENKKIITKRNDSYSFKDIKVDGEEAFKDALFENNNLIDLYDDLSLVCDVEGIIRESVEEHYKKGRDYTDLTRAKTTEEYMTKEKEEEIREEAERSRLLNYAATRMGNNNIDPEDMPS